jgi:hypothetical protein
MKTLIAYLLLLTLYSGSEALSFGVSTKKFGVVAATKPSASVKPPKTVADGKSAAKPAGTTNKPAANKPVAKPVAKPLKKDKKK